MDYFEQLNLLGDFLNEDTKKVSKTPKETTDFVCTYCKAVNKLIYDYSNATQICTGCGIIAAAIVGENNETRYYGATDNKSVDPTRCGKPINPLLPKSSLGTCMTIIGGKYSSLNRLHKWNQMPADERSLYDVFKKIDILVRDTTLNRKIIGQTKQYYKILSEKDEKLKGFLTRGNIRKSLIAACLLVACKNNSKPMRESEIAEICGITATDVTRGLKKFSELEKNRNIKINNFTNNMHDYINKYCNKLNISENLIKIVHFIFIRAKKLNMLRNSNNTSICSGLLYFISQIFDLGIKKSDLIKIIHISEVTLNKIYKEFLTNKRILLIGFDKIDFVN